MTEGGQKLSPRTPANIFTLKKLLWLTVLVALMALLATLALLMTAKPGGPLTQLNLADGRILQIEGVTYGTKHHMGRPSIIVDRFGPWLPQKVRDWLTPKSPENTIELERPGLVVWVNAIDPVTGANVDCQSIRTEFVDRHGDLFGEETRHWFGGRKFWRVGHVFLCYPRDEAQLTFRVTPWKKDAQIPVTAQLKNPHTVTPASWSADPLPQTRTNGAFAITLAGLNPRTNEAKYWQTPSAYLEPNLEFRQNGLPVNGWSKPEWFAEDPTGNRGQYLGQHQPVLRFHVTIYPTATNTDIVLPVATLPRVDLSFLTNQILWNSKLAIGTNEVVALGICPAGTYTFTNGNFDPTGPRTGAVRGGAKSGWVSQASRVTPMRLQVWHSHFTPIPTIYLRAARLAEPDRLALRLRDEQGRYWIADAEPQGAKEDVHPFLIELPPEVTVIVPELVLLKPAQAEFLVKTAAAQ